MCLTITNLTKTYSNGVRAMDQISLQIGKGMFGLLGPNGAGKSTLMRTIATLQQPDSGDILFDDIQVISDPMRLRKILGYLPQEFGIYPKVSAESLLHYFARLKGIKLQKERNLIVEKVLQLTNLFDDRKKHVSSYSGGMKQRFGIAQLLLNDPKLIIVDEPTAGLDPAERVRFLNILREIGNENTVIFSTHIVEDVKDLCHEMAIMNKGNVLQHLTPRQAIQSLEGKIWTTTVPAQDLEQMEQGHQVLSSGYNPDNSVTIRVYALQQPTTAFSMATPTLEDAYFKALN